MKGLRSYLALLMPQIFGHVQRKLQIGFLASKYQQIKLGL